MSKALILIDVPDNLDITQFKVDCKLVNKVFNDNYTSKDIKLFDLKPIPQKKCTSSGSSYDIIENRGYNICIDEILGEKNG